MARTTTRCRQRRRPERLTVSTRTAPGLSELVNLLGRTSGHPCLAFSVPQCADVPNIWNL